MIFVHKFYMFMNNEQNTFKLGFLEFVDDG